MHRMELERQICGLLVFLLAIQHVDGLSEISESRRTARTVNLTLTCRDSGIITNQVNFVKDSSLIGGCSPGCGTGVSGYAVSQNIAAQETYLTISSLENSDCGNWTCKQGTDPDSPTFFMECPLSCFLDPSTDITVTPEISSLTSAENISVQVMLPCCTKNADINWTYQKQNGIPITVASTTTTPSGSCPAGQTRTLNTFQPQRADFPTSGKMNLSLRIEHDSFDPPGYTVVYTKEIDLGETTTLPASPTTSNNTSETTTLSTATRNTTPDISTSTPGGPTTSTPNHEGICKDNLCYLFLLLLLIPIGVIVWCCVKKKKTKKSDQENSNKMAEINKPVVRL